jgi:Thymidine kinase
MSDIVYYYGVMGAGKSEELLRKRYEYEIRGSDAVTLAVEPGVRPLRMGEVSSRVGETAPAIVVNERPDWSAILDTREADVILIDEAQFLSPQAVIELVDYADTNDIPVKAFGLKADAFNHWFPGSSEWFIRANQLHEIDTMCKFCNNKAVMNLRLTDDDEQIVLTKSVYTAVCREHHKAVTNHVEY